MHNQWTWVDTNKKMTKAYDHMVDCPLICLDTEYDSFRYFRERLCLIQIKAKDHTYLIDPLADIQMDCLGDVLADSAILKILHAGDNDIRILKRDYSFEFNHIFDTQRAASTLGCQYLSLATLINQYLGIEFDKKKKLQRSQWETRPLSDDQLHYAVEDTLYLEPLYKVFDEEIRRKGFMPDLQKNLQDMTSVTWHEKPFDCMGYRRIRDSRCLTADQKLRLKALYEWRYLKAKELNRAMFMILSDQDLIELCRQEPRSPQDLQVFGKMSSEKINRYGADVIEILQHDDSTPLFDV